MRSSRWYSSRPAAVVCRFGAVVILTGMAVPAWAEDPIDRCLDSSTASGGGNPASESFTPREPNLYRPNSAPSDSRIGSVDPKTGAYTYSNEDISVGSGDFPTKLSVIRTFLSSADGPNSSLPPFAAGAPARYPFGRGSTMNWDVTWNGGQSSFNGKTYGMTYIRMGFKQLAYQRCANGTDASSQLDGSRILPSDPATPNNAFRLQMKDGSTLFFDRLQKQYPEAYCNAAQDCGVLTKWLAPNGDWATFEYETYYSHPSNYPTAGSHAGSQIYSTASLGVAPECHVTTQGQNDCRDVNHPAYYTIVNSGWAPQGSNPIYMRRLKKISNSRGYYLLFSYVDQTTNEGGGFCQAAFNNLSCTFPIQNPDYSRNKISSISAYGVNSAGGPVSIGTVSYQYSARYPGDPYQEYISSYVDLEGNATSYTFIGNNYSINLPGQNSPVVSVDFTPEENGYYWPNIKPGQADYPNRTILYYDRAASMTLGDGHVTTFVPAESHRWQEEKYGTYVWNAYFSQMRIDEGGGVVTNYYYNDASEDHFSPVRIVDPLGRVNLFSYLPDGSLFSATNPETVVVSYSYDARGNVLTRSIAPKPGSGLTPITESLVYVGAPTVSASACINQMTCNRVVSRIDPRGNETDYQWDTATGLPLGEQGPPAPDGQRPAASYSYGLFAGVGGSSITLVTGITTKISGTDTETTSLAYTSDTRLLPKARADTAGSTVLRRCYQFDARGNMIAETTPRANLSVCP